MLYVVLCWSCLRAVMRLPDLEASEGGNVCGVYGLPAGFRCWSRHCCLGGFRLGCPFRDFLLLFVLLWPVVIPVSLRWFFSVCCVRKRSWQFFGALCGVEVVSRSVRAVWSVVLTQCSKQQYCRLMQYFTSTIFFDHDVHQSCSR